MTLWYRYRMCDRKRYRREGLELYARSDLAKTIHALACSKDGTELDRLALADLAEENDLPYLAMFLRANMTTVPPKWVGRVKKARRKR